MFLSNKLNMGAGTPAPASDPQFNNVTMLLHGDGTNGAQNNTFLDSGPTGFTITRNGNTTQGSFSPYGSNWSNYFGGVSRIYTPHNSTFEFGTGDFTIECWINMAGGTPLLAYWRSFLSVCADGTSDGNGVTLYVTDGGSGSSVVGEVAVNIGTTRIFSGQDIRGIGWVHVAVTRQGTTNRLFLNGVLKSTITNSLDINATNYGASIGLSSLSNVNYFIGYISNVRVVKGTAVYTSNFTPSTTPLTVISGTSLLTCADNRFIDEANNIFITIVGTPSVERFNPFGTSTAYSTSVIGGSGFLDGTGDYLNTASSADFTLTTSEPFTVECWVYLNGSQSSSFAAVMTNMLNFSSQYGNRWAFTINGLNLRWYNSNGDAAAETGLFPYQWIHLAAVRNSGIIYIYVNGVLIGSQSSNQAYNLDGSLKIGFLTGAAAFKGYITDARIVKNTAVYTSAFTPPTSPLTAIENTTFLASMTNGAIFDNAMIDDLETVGSAQISTSVVKYGTGSLNINGSSSYPSGTAWLKGVVPNPNFTIGTGDFTVEGWFYQTDIGSTYQSILEINNHLGVGGILFIGNTSGNACVYAADTGGGAFVAPQATTANVWQHIAFVRNNGTLRTYVNGISTSSQPDFTLNIQCTIGLTVGCDRTGNGAYFYYGYMDELRVTRYARYTANFTPPTAAFPNTGPY